MNVILCVLVMIKNCRKQYHKCLVSVLGLCDASRQPYVVTDFIAGESLKDVLLKQDDQNALSWKEKLKLVRKSNTPKINDSNMNYK